MTHRTTIKTITYLAMSLLALFTLSCSGLKPVAMSGKEWSISNYYGQAIDKDSTFCFSFWHNTLVDKDTPLIGSEDSLRRNPELYKYAQEILRLSRLENAEVLLYAPKMGVMFVKLPSGYVEPKPNSQSANMLDSKPWTGWVRDDDVEKWERKEDQMYTNLYYDKGKKMLTIADRFNYGDLPIARIQIIQTRTKPFMKRFPDGKVSSVWASLDKVEHLEAFSNWIDWHRKVSFENYSIGQKKKRGERWQNF
ncbi:hypothetical protein [Bacteroides acidifaciens]|mgnify:CR=1 FL=1|uniref:hypothetical protein n=1 Tax=Bacteroides acidifaciens TaxID=85831 RepID=UPI0025A50820|nr:hypothetical protein [Bacteroides acidifaciens]